MISENNLWYQKIISDIENLNFCEKKDFWKSENTPKNTKNSASYVFNCGVGSYVPFLSEMTNHHLLIIINKHKVQFPLNHRLTHRKIKYVIYMYCSYYEFVRKMWLVCILFKSMTTKGFSKSILHIEVKFKRFMGFSGVYFYITHVLYMKRCHAAIWLKYCRYGVKSHWPVINHVSCAKDISCAWNDMLCAQDNMPVLCIQ